MARRERVASGRRAFAQLVRPQPKDFDAAPSGRAQGRTQEAQASQAQASLHFESSADTAELWIALQPVAARSAADASHTSPAQMLA